MPDTRPRPPRRVSSRERSAATLRALGWPILPTTADSAKAPVVPAGSNWREPQNHVKPKRKVLSAAAKGQQLISIIPPSDVVVIDIDDRKAGRALFEYLGVDLLRSTLAVRSGNGYHLYFCRPKDDPTINGSYKKRAASGLLPNKLLFWQHIDVRTNGYMIAPPSLHYSGKTQYQFYDNGHDRPAKMPKELRKLFKKLYKASSINGHKVNGHKINGATVKPDASPGEPKVTKEVLEQLLESISPSVYANDLDGYHRIAAAVHYTCAGAKWGKRLFLEWSASDPAYNTPRHARANAAIWDNCRLDSKGKTPITHRTFIAELKEHSTLPEDSGLYAAIGDYQRKSQEELLKLFRDKKADAPRRESATDNVLIDIPGYDQRKILELINGTDADKEILVAAVLGEMELDHSDFDYKLAACLHIIERLEKHSKREIWQTKIKTKTGVSAQALRMARKEVQAEIREQSDFEVQDVVSRATLLYAERNDVIASQGRLYEQTKVPGLYRTLNEHALGAHLVSLLRSELQLFDRENVPTLVRSAVDLLRLERNVDDKGAVWARSLEDDSGVITAAQRLHWRDSSIFQAYRDLQLCQGISVINTTNAEIRINYRKQVKRLRKKLDGKTVRDYIDPYMPTAQLLSLPIDVELSSMKGVVSIDRRRNNAFHLSTTAVPYMSDKKALAAIKAGKVDTFIYYLDLITQGFTNDERIEFITAFLDMLAYVMQPVRHSPVFFLLFGQSGAGKSMSSHILASITQPGSVAKNSLAKLANNDQFGDRDLVDRLYVYEDDAPPFNRETVAKLKELTHGNEVIEVNQKHLNDNLLFLSSHVIGVLSNHAPRMTDPSGAIRRRAQVFRFVNSIAANFDEFKHGKRVLTEEAQYIFNILRLRIPRILASPKWYQSPAMLQELHTITRGDMLSQVIDNLLEPAPGERVNADDLMLEYKRENMAFGTSRSAQISFTMLFDRVREHGYIVDGRDIVDVRIKKSKMNKQRLRNKKK